VDEVLCTCGVDEDRECDPAGVLLRTVLPWSQFIRFAMVYTESTQVELQEVERLFGPIDQRNTAT
jgi:hypothetical protein